MALAKTPMGSLRVAGLVLAGGLSRRFGREKAAAVWRGRPLLAWSLEALEGGCETVAVSAAAGSAAETLARSEGRTVLHDDPLHPSGPLAGVAAGLAWAAALGFDALATLPCDTPLVGPLEVRALIAALGEAQAAHAVTEDGVQSLCAVWRCSLEANLAATLAAGDHPAVQRLLDRTGSRPVRFPDPTRFRNANTETDLASFGRLGPR
jgi:molybdopterin-guanine dinucleotide biosynthesis protein A